MKAVAAPLAPMGQAILTAITMGRPPKAFLPANLREDSPKVRFRIREESMRRSFRCAVIAGVAVLVACGVAAAPLAAQEPRQGTVIVPPSNVEQPQDIGKRAHTNFLIFVPAARAGKPAPNTNSGPAGETPSSLACVYQVGPNNGNTSCPELESGSSMNYDNPAGGTNVIAIVDAYDYPTAASDFLTFSQTFGLPSGDQCGSSGTAPCFTVQYASGTKPQSNCGWAQEEALDIEWSHAMAPHAQIVLVEAASNSNANLLQAVSVANTLIANAGGKGEVSMSWGSSEFSSESSYDSYFGQPGVTYFASSGDSGGKVIWPSASPDVVSAGGTTVNRDSNGNFTGESTWSSAGGGPSADEVMPPYQNIIADINTSGMRGTPDLSFDANPASGVSVYDGTSCQGLVGWLVFGGTSVASPSLAGLVNNAGAFDGGWDGGSNSSSVSNNLYANYATDTNSSTDPATCSYSSATPFYDVTSGSAGTYNAGTCWDFASGVGSERGFSGPNASSGGGTTIAVSSVSLNPTIVTGGGSSSGTVTLSAAPTSSTTVLLSNSNTSAATVPASVVVPAGSTSTGFTVTTSAVSTQTTATITATYNSSSAHATLTVNPASSGGGSFTISASPGSVSVRSGGTATYTVTVTPSGGYTGTVNLSVKGVPNGSTSSFSSTSIAGGSGTSTLTVTDASSSRGNYTLTITGTDSSGSPSSSTTVGYKIR